MVVDEAMRVEDGRLESARGRAGLSRTQTLALLLAGGVCLLAADLLSQYLILPFWLEDLGRVLYKLFFLITLPFRWIAVLLFPRVDHHWPLAHHLLTSLGTPFFLWGVWRSWRRISGRFRARREVRASAPSPGSINRRQFLARSAAGAVGVATGGLGSYASLVAPEILRVRRYAIPVAGLPPEFDGLRIVHVSDTHYGPYVSMPFLEQVFERANALGGDLVLLTGDYVHYTPESIGPGIDALRRLQARYGAAAVMGNHEHWEGAEACRERFRRIGLPLLDNARLFLTPDGLGEACVPGRSVCVAGVGDLWEDEVSFEKALDGVPEDVPRIILSHNPDAAEIADPRHRIDLMLSGHTHGGQISLPVIGPPVAPSAYGEKYLGGLCQGPSCPVVVSRGVGLAGVPLRLGVPPELGVITLRRA
jgi:predicted MPP superfamily phosphohydrolase